MSLHLEKVTLRQVVAWRPCYHVDALIKLFNDRYSINAEEIVELPISNYAKMWALCHKEFLSKEECFEIACTYIEHAISMIGSLEHYKYRFYPQIFLDTVEMKRKQINNQIKDNIVNARIKYLNQLESMYNMEYLYGANSICRLSRASVELFNSKPRNCVRDVGESCSMAVAFILFENSREKETQWQLQQLLNRSK